MLLIFIKEKEEWETIPGPSSVEIIDDLDKDIFSVVIGMKAWLEWI